MKYVKRIIEDEIKSYSNIGIGVLITGVKGCGKTETSKRFANSQLILDETEETRTNLLTNPNVILEGAKPRLIDEWQLYPWVFNKVRHAIDDKKGSFILTGSATPIADNSIHSGSGRFVEFLMYPMTWYELSYSDGSISLEDVFADKIPNTRLVTIPIDERLTYLKYGGWPFLLGLDNVKKDKVLGMYVTNICKKDLSRLMNTTPRTSKILLKLLMSLARNISTSVSLPTIQKDINDQLSLPSLRNYCSCLERMFVIETLSSWRPHIRSSASLRKLDKRYFVDPSLAVSILGLSIEQLKEDFNYVGFLFENEVVKNLRVYAERIRATLYYYAETFTSTVNGKKQTVTKEVDVIMEKPNGDWCAFEIKFRFGDDTIENAAKNLKNMMDHLDFKKVKKPCSLNIITSDGSAFKRPDGINVIPLCFLK